MPRPKASRPWRRPARGDVGLAFEPAVADPDWPGGTAPATTGFAYWTEPGSGSASVWSTALLGCGNVSYGNDVPRTVVGASGSEGSSKLRNVANPELSWPAVSRPAPSPAWPARPVPGRRRVRATDASAARFGFPLRLFFAGGVTISSGEPATLRCSGPKCAFRFS